MLLSSAKLVLALLGILASTQHQRADGLPEAFEDVEVSGDLRQLQDVSVGLPSQLTVSIGDELSGIPGTDLDLVAGKNYSAGIQLVLTERNFSDSLAGLAKLRLVSEGTPAQSGGCSRVENQWPGGHGFFNGTIPLHISSNTARSEGSISFMLGGRYRLCYSHDGSFDETSELLETPRNLQVRGAGTNCKTDDCLERQQWFCFVYKDDEPATGSCMIRLDSIEYVNNISETRLSWGPTVRIVLGNTLGWSCGSAGSTKLHLGYPAPVVGSFGRDFTLHPLPSNEGFSVQACYCPGYKGCDADENFIQAVGRVHFFSLRLCSGTSCVKEIPSALAASPFSLHVDCAGAQVCDASSGNRMKVIDVGLLGVNDRPSWAEHTGCRTRQQTANYWRPYNCLDGDVAQCGGLGGEVNGGSASDVKVFGGIILGPTYVAGVPSSRTYDICYCDERCDAGNHTDAVTRFHKVGRFHVRPYTLLKYRDSGSKTGIETVGVVGDLMVDGRGNIPLAPHPAQIKILWDNTRTKTSVDCRGLRDLVTFPAGEGPECTSADDCSYKASTVETDPPDGFAATGEVVNFNDGGTQGERLRFLLPGMVAICYCGLLGDDGSCFQGDGASYWILIARTLVRGPCVLTGDSQQCVEETWTFFTGVPFHLSLRGLGLSSADKLRIIPEGNECRENPDGGGEATVLKGCPDDCNALNLANAYAPGKDDVDLSINSAGAAVCNVGEGASCTAAHIVELLPQTDHTIWRFDRDPGVEEGDLVVLEDVTGGTEEENRLMAGRVGLEPLGWPVTRLPDPLLLRVPAHLDSGVQTRFQSNGGWWRHNVAHTRQELLSLTPKNLLQVCWGSGPDTYHARAGRISFVAPASMTSAMVGMSGFEAGRRAPVVVAFTTNSGGDSATKYRASVNSMQLRLSFIDVAKFEPLMAGVDGEPLPLSAPADRNSLQSSAQSVCGSLFVEMWSDDEKGFPLPRGCYFSSLRQKTRDLHLVFEPRSGLEPGQNYQLVLNARASLAASSLVSVLTLFSMDDVVEAPYSVVEHGDARLSRNPQPSSGEEAPRFMSSGGLTLLDGSGELRDLLELTSDPASLLLRLRGDGRSRIAAGSRLRIFLWPLTVWSLEPRCQAQCYPHRTRTCGAIASCDCEAVVSGSQRNVLRVQLPDDMTEIYGATVQHTIHFSELALPSLGFFGTRFAGQVSLPDDSQVHYVESSGAQIWKAPDAQDPQMTLASLVTHEGDGNDRPFRGDAGNRLFLRLGLGASLRSELATGDALFRLTLPPGFSCRTVAPAPSTLGVFGARQPQGRGSLPASSSGDGAAGTWQLSGRTCEYRLAPGELLPARSRLFLQVTVDQPDFPLQKLDILNRWTVALSSKGWFRWVRQEVPPVPFVDGTLLAGEFGDFAASLPLLGKLVYDNIQPSSFQAGFRRNILQIFFRPEQSSGYRAMVLVSGPIGFNFALDPPESCRVDRLPDIYYRSTGGSSLRTVFLPILEACTCDCSLTLCPEGTLNRAAVRVKNSLQPESHYGFRLEVTNSLNHQPGDKLAWTLGTVDSFGHRLDASYPNARLNPAVGGTNRGWSIFENDLNLDPASLAISSLRPTLTAPSTLSITSIQLPRDARAGVRLMVPDGFRLSPADFISHASMLSSVSANWPGGQPLQSRQTNPGLSNPYGDQAENVLLWEEALYLASETYGFAVKVSVPAHPVVSTSLLVLLEFGWAAEALAERVAARALPMPQVLSITNFAVQHSSNIAAVNQLLTVVLETSADLPVDGVLRLLVPGGFTFDERCSLEAVQGERPPPELLDCRSQREAEGVTAVAIRAVAAVWQSGRKAFSLRVRNPREVASNRAGQETLCGFELCWLVQALDSRGVPMEMEAAAPGFSINRRMPEARLLDLSHSMRIVTGRDDRPGMENNLVFAFQLARRPSGASELLLSGPFGYLFDEDCLPGLALGDGPIPERNVFGHLPWLLGYTKWEVAAEVRSCSGRGSVASLQVERGLHSGKAYALRLRVASNPLETPSPNLWSLEFSGESSGPFEGFDLWTFTEYGLTPATRAASASASAVAAGDTRVAVPVQLSFRPQNEVPNAHEGTAADGDGLGGLLRVEAPADFQAATEGPLDQSCAAYYLEGGTTPFLPDRDFQCQPGGAARPNQLSFRLIGSRRLEAVRVYNLTVHFYNPPMATSEVLPWRTTTFRDGSGTQEATLDATLFPGYAIEPRPQRWAVTAPAGEQHAGTLAVGVAFRASLRSALSDGDLLLITAPDGFDLAAERYCIGQVGVIRGGARERVGSSSSLQECVEAVWQETPDATASSWNTMDFRCFAHFGIQRVEACGLLDGSGSGNSNSNSNSNASSGAKNASCSAYVHHVCSFAGRTRGCRGFRWRQQVVAGLPEPYCREETLSLRLGPEHSLAEATELAFTLDPRNPSGSPRLLGSLWRLEHRTADGSLEATAAAGGWPVVPSLLSASARLTGALRAAGALSQLTLHLTPSSSADSLRLSVLAPDGFDFSLARAALALLGLGAGTGAGASASTELQSLEVLQRAQASITLRCELTARRVLEPLVVEEVLLGGPGPAEFRLATFSGQAKADESLFLSGASSFHVPGRIQVLERRLDTAHRLLVNSTHTGLDLQPRAGDTCVATYRLLLGATTLPGDVLTVSASPFSFSDADAGSSISDSLSSRSSVFRLSEVSSGVAVATFLDLELDGGAGLRMLLVAELRGDSPLLLQLPARSGPLQENGERWRFRLQRPSRPGLPVSTNDEGETGFTLVHALVLSLEVGRVAPASMVDVRVTVNPGDSRPEQLILRLPPGFSFPAGSCIRGDPGPAVLACRRLQQENLAELQLSVQGLQLAASVLVAVVAPSLQDPSADNLWLVQSRSEAKETGWGLALGFSITEMEAVRLVYAPLPAREADLAAIFTTTQGLLGGGVVELRAPEAYRLRCPISGNLQQLGLPGVQLCSDVGPSLRLVVNETIAPGSYAFVVQITNPSALPSDNSFDLLLRDHYDNVVDAQMHLAGHPLIQGLDVLPSQLRFSSSTPYTQAEIHVTLRASADMNPAEALGPVRALQVGIPERFVLITREPVRNLDGLPTPESSWFHLLYTERLVRVDLVRQESEMPDIIPKGDYRLSFQVRLPEFWMPSVNVWILSLCRDLRCTDIIADVAFAGFLFGDQPSLHGEASDSTDSGNAETLREVWYCFILVSACASVVWWRT